MTGASTPQLILMPGFDGTGELFAPLQAALGSEISAKVVRYNDERVFNDYVESVAALLPAHGAVLVAESFSGPVALALMARYPEHIKGAVLCATFATSPYRFLTRLARFVPAPCFSPSVAQLGLSWKFAFDGNTDPDVRENVLRVVGSLPSTIIQRRLNVLAAVDMGALLPTITAPVLYLQAQQDKVVSAHLSHQLTSALPNVTVRSINSPHLLLQCRAAECATEIRTFLTVNNHLRGVHDN